MGNKMVIFFNKEEYKEYQELILANKTLKDLESKISDAQNELSKIHSDIELLKPLQKELEKYLKEKQITILYHEIKPELDKLNINAIYNFCFDTKQYIDDFYTFDYPFDYRHRHNRVGQNYYDVLRLLADIPKYVAEANKKAEEANKKAEEANKNAEKKKREKYIKGFWYSLAGCVIVFAIFQIITLVHNNTPKPKPKYEMVFLM